MENEDIRKGEKEVMKFLMDKRQEPFYLSKIHTVTGYSNSYIHEILEKFLEEEWIEKEEVKNYDGYHKEISLTEEGKEKFKKILGRN